MILRDLEVEYPDYAKEHTKLEFSHYVRDSTKEKGRLFWERMKSEIATVLDWVNAPEVNVQEEVQLEENERKIVENHKKRLYDWWLEFKVQKNIMRDWDAVIRYAPAEIKRYAEQELAELIRFTSGHMEGWEELNYTMKRGLSFNFKFKNLFSIIEQVGYQSPWNIHDKNGLHEAEALLRYKGYLKQIVETGLQRKKDEDEMPGDFSFKNLWPEFLDFSENLTVGFSSEKTYRDKKEHLYFHVYDVSGAVSGDALKHYVKLYFQLGFERLLPALEEIGQARRMDVLNELKYHTEWFLNLIWKDEHVEKDGKERAIKYRYFERFTNLKYKGDEALRLAFDESLRVLLDLQLDEIGFIKGWVEGIQEVARKLENVYNNLELLGYGVQPTYDIYRIFENVFVLESEKAALQGTAFHVKNVGIITCDHCVRNPETGQLCSDLLLFRRESNRKVRVEVVKTHAILDVAILQIMSDEDEFLSEGLSMGSSDNIKQLDVIGVAGFPYYNLGDEGYFTKGKVTGFKKISSIKYILVDNGLVAGNSGGPGLDINSRVIGIVNIGVDNFQKVKGTEKHGLTPIEVIQLLE